MIRKVKLCNYSLSVGKKRLWGPGNRAYHRSLVSLHPRKEERNEVIHVAETKEDYYSSFKRLMYFSRKEWKWIGLSASTLGVTSSITLIIPHVSGFIVDYTINNQGGDGYSPLVLATGLFGLSTIAGGGVYLRSIWLARAGNRIVARLKQQLYSSILDQETAFLAVKKSSTGDMISRLTQDATVVQSAVTTQAVAGLRGIIMSLGSTGMLLYTSPSLAAISCCTLPPVFIMTRQVGRKLANEQKAIQELLGQATSLAEQSLNHSSTVKQFNAESFEKNRYSNSIAEAHSKALDTAHVQAQLETGAHIAGNAAILGVIGYGGTIVLDGTISAGDLTGFIIYSLLLAGNLSNLTAVYSDLVRALAASNRIFDILDRTPKIQSVKQRKFSETVGLHKINDDPLVPTQYARNPSLSQDTNVRQKPPSISIQGLNFSYPSRPNVQVMNDFNLEIAPGEVIALVGGSGSGKSTIANLLTRLYDTEEKSIRINDKFIQDFDLLDLRQMIGVVSQDPVLFRGTIRDNIRYGEWENASDEDILEAAKQAHVLEFATSFPDGLDTEVGPTLLSGGQRQRIALARVLIKQSPILILDEATSALDAQSEHLVQEALQKVFIKGGRTIISIAHRLSTIRHASRIAVVENGSIVQTGTFEKLQGTDGPFRELMRTQLLTAKTEQK